jgi:PEGA domain-containing protein
MNIISGQHVTNYGKIRSILTSTIIFAITGATLCLSIFGCAEAPSNPSHSAVSTAPRNLTKTIQIISEPPGARIEVNNDYVGDAPCSVGVTADTYGNFAKTTIIRALPVGFGYVQNKFFLVPPYNQNIPSRILFDTGLGPVAPQIDVNVNQ